MIHMKSQSATLTASERPQLREKELARSRQNPRTSKRVRANAKSNATDKGQDQTKAEVNDYVVVRAKGQGPDIITYNAQMMTNVKSQVR